MWHPRGPVYEGIVFAVVVLALVTFFLITTSGNAYRLDDGSQRRLGVTPATTVSRFWNHFIAGFFHTNLVHIGFNLTLFTLGYWLAVRERDPLQLLGTSYFVGMFTVFSLHLLLVLPLAALKIDYAVRSLDHPLVGFSVIAYATLGAGLLTLDRSTQLVALALVVILEVVAAFFFTFSFISVYHLVGLALGAYLTWLARVPLTTT